MKKHASLLFRLFGTTDGSSSDVVKEELNVLRDRKARRDATGIPLKVESLHVDIHKDGSFVTYREILLIGDRVCSIVIDSDSKRLEFCTAELSVLHSMQWNLFVTIPYQVMSTPPGLSKIHDGDSIDHFQQDRAIMIKKAALIFDRIKD